MSKNYVMCIGSAGDDWGASFTKAKSTKGYLSTRDDIRDAEKFFMKYLENCSVIAGYEVRGMIGSAKECYASIKKFYKKCQDDDARPTLYYTGHGDSEGDWRFPNDGWISIEMLTGAPCGGGASPDWYTGGGVKPRGSSYPMDIISDCCYSGKWVQWSEENRSYWMVTAASGPNQVAHDRLFAEAVFNAKDSERKKLKNERGAVIRKYGPDQRMQPFEGVQPW